MARVYCVSYDLHRPGKNYDGLIGELKKSSNWWHHLASTWLIVTNESANDLFERLRPNLDTNDNILIIKVGRDYSGWLTQDAWKWIDAQVPVAV